MKATKNKAASTVDHTRKAKGTAAGRRLVRAMRDAAAFMEGEASAGRIVFPKPPKIDVAAVRARTGLSQNEFARRFMLAPGTLKNWEQGIRQPEGASRLLLAVIDRDPDVVSQVAQELAGGRSI